MDDTNHAQHDEKLDNLIQFPAEFPIKIMGKNTADFRHFVEATIEKLIPPEKLIRLNEQMSSGDKYMSFTLVAVFDSQAEIDAVYRELSSNPLVLMAL